MYISKVTILNFKCFKGQFCLDLNKGLNVLVGNNETGKSTILEAIHLALSGLLNGKHLRLELSQDIFNNDVRNDYLQSLKGPIEAELIPLPPEIIIEVFIDGVEEDSLKAPS
ncbi:MAG: chromosome segregation protein [Syntrophorhabdaceae bacterium PtaU1.Bin034]|nr:MAG: chromosome segregation protein [Syntrophorhabdaceae bacterium PtaU1.Bin034]